METYDSSINRFNGQYLKCIVSNYTASKNYLGNSGSLIVIQPKSGKLNDTELEAAYENGTLHRNYVYLGNEFLASGFGFGSQYVLEKAENVINRYDDNLEELREADAALDDKIDESVESLLSKLNNYVKINGGRIENTYVRINGYDILTKDIILYGEEAKYQNMEVKNIEISIDGSKCEDNEIFLPIGSKISEINVNVEVAKNDSGGINSLQVLHNFENEEVNNYEGTKILYDLDTDLTLDATYGIYKIFYSKRLTEAFIIDSYKKNVLKSFYINVKGTPLSAYKYYPIIYNKYGIEIISSGNAIADNTIDIAKYISIRPQYYVKYSPNGILNDNDFSEYIPLNSFKNFDDTVIRFVITNQMNSSRNIYIAVPSNFSVHKIYIVKHNTELYNWTGAVSIARNKKLRCVHSNTHCINYDIYNLNAESGFYNANEESEGNYQVEMEIVYNYAKQSIPNYDADYNVNKPIQSNVSELINTNIFNDFINDEDFNNLYWINYNKTYPNNIDSLKNRLNNTEINGSIKN